MKILVTGASGFIGRNLVEYLSERYEVLSPDRTELNLLEENSVDTYFRHHTVDVVIHAAGKPGHRNAADPSGVFYADTRMYFNLVRNREYFGKLLITGSGGIYDQRCYRPNMKEEDWSLNIPVDEHGFFRYVTAHHIRTMPGVVDLRLFGIFGKYEDYAIRFISNAICKAIFDLPITIRQNRRFDYLYIDDFCRVVCRFLSCKPRHHEYNVTPGSPLELLDLARRVVTYAGRDVPIIVTKEGMGMEYSADNSRLLEEIPEFTFTPIDSAIACLYEWYREHRQNVDRNSLLIDK